MMITKYLLKFNKKNFFKIIIKRLNIKKLNENFKKKI